MEGCFFRYSHMILGAAIFRNNKGGRRRERWRLKRPPACWQAGLCKHADNPGAHVLTGMNYSYSQIEVENY